MKVAGFPTSSDIYLEVDGKKVAVVQSYTAKSSRTSQTVEAFGEDEPESQSPAEPLPSGRPPFCGPPPRCPRCPA